MSTESKYMRLMFGGVPRTSDEKEKAWVAFCLAHEIRMFEIGLYWKRALYFWGFQSVIFAGFAVLIAGNILQDYKLLKDFIIPLFALVGLVAAIAWYYVNKGSKAWQENWENHIDLLEENFSGSLYKTITKDVKSFYSVSKINECVSLFITTVWVVIMFCIVFDGFPRIRDFFSGDFYIPPEVELYIWRLLFSGAFIGFIAIVILKWSVRSNLEHKTIKESEVVRREINIESDE